MKKQQLLSKMSLLLKRPITERPSERDEDELDISQLSHKLQETRDFNNKLMHQMADILNEKDDEPLFTNEAENMEMAAMFDFGLSSKLRKELEMEHGQTYLKEQIEHQKYLEVVYMDQFQEVAAYTDQWPFLLGRKKLMYFLTLISYCCQRVIKSALFEGLVLIVILWNSVMLAMDDPTDDSQSELSLALDEGFLIFYTIEMGFKIFAMGFLFCRGAYLRDPWNILDFIIIVTGYLPYVVASASFNLTALRALRVLRPLRTINKIRALRDIIQCLFGAITLLRDSIVVLVFCYTVFAIGGLQLFMGLLKKRCFSASEGIEADETDDYPFCSTDSDCADNEVCGKMLKNPDWDITNFDTFGWSFLMVYQVCTLEGWAYIMNAVQQTFSPWLAIYFVVLALIGAFFLINLVIAIIKVKFSEQQASKGQVQEEEKDEEEQHYSLEMLRTIGVYDKKRPSKTPSDLELQSYFGKDCKMIPRDICKQQAGEISAILFEASNFEKLLTLEGEKTPATPKQIEIPQHQGNRQHDTEFTTQQLNLPPVSTPHNGKPLKIPSNLRMTAISSEPVKMKVGERRVNFAGMAGYVRREEKKQIRAHGRKQSRRGSSMKMTKKLTNLGKSSRFLIPNDENRDKSRHASSHQDEDDEFFDFVDSQQNNEEHHHQRRSFKHSIISKSSGSTNKHQQLPDILEQGFLKPPMASMKSFRNPSFRNKVPASPQNSGSMTVAHKKQASNDESGKSVPPKLNFAQRQQSIRSLGTIINPQAPAAQPTRSRWVTQQKTLDFEVSSESEGVELADDDAIQQNIRDLGLEEAYPHAILAPPPPELSKSKMISQAYRRQEIQKLSYRPEIESEDEDLTKEQLIIKEKLMNSKRLITGIIKVRESEWVNETDVLENKAARERQRLVEAEQRFRDRIKISLTYRLEEKKPYRATMTSGPSMAKVQPLQDSNMVDPSKRLINRNKFLRNYVKLNWTYENIQNLINKDIEVEEIDQQQQPQVGQSQTLRLGQQPLSPVNQVPANQPDPEEQYADIRNMDVYQSHGLIETNWGGLEVIPNYRLASFVVRCVNHDIDDVTIWVEGFLGAVQVSRKYVKFFVQSKLYETMIMMAVLLNTIILALEGLVSANDQLTLDQISYACTMIFTIDMGLKLIALGTDYFRDSYNIFDGLIVSLSLVELVFSGGSKSLQAFRSVRIFRVFRVLRVTRLIRSLRYMAVILDVIGRQIESIFYIFVLLCLLMYIFILLGMEAFGNKFDKQIRQNYNSFLNAFVCVFQLVTLENWNDILHAALRSDQYIALSLGYLIVWIFIGNYIFLNLFLSILLEGFEKKQQEDDVKELEQELEVAQNIEFDFSQVKTMKTSRKPSDTVFSQYQKVTTYEYFVEPDIAEYSCFLFSQSNFFRKVCYRVVKDPRFEYVIFVAIILTSIQLVMETYITYDDNVAYGINITFTIFFTIEAIMKIVAFGFVLNPYAYLTESWSQLDFFIVLISWVDIAVTSVDLSFVRILKLLRTLRPLRFISHNVQMKLVVTALLESVSGIMNVVVVILLVWMMFAILGINLMKDNMQYCSGLPIQISVYDVDETRCGTIVGASWVTNDMNFDNIINAMVSLFVLSTFENWPVYAYQWVDGSSSGPVKDNQPYFIFYVVGFILIGSMFLINLFVGVISLSYSMAESRAKNQFLTEEQSNWIEIQRLIIASRPFFPNQFSPENRFRAVCYTILKNRVFDSFIMLCILCNIATMAMAYETSPNDYDEVLANMNTAFTAVFIAEATLKLIAYGITGYFMNGWNQFDFFVVVASIVDFILNYVGSGVQGLKVGPQLARIFRVLRVTRLLRLIKSFDGLRKLIQTAIFSLPQLMNVLSLLMLSFFILSILACQLFSTITSGTMIGSQFNFHNFSNAFLVLFTSASGENWYILMFDTTHGPNGSGWNILFWVAFVVIMQYIMLNLFVLVVLQQFEQNYINETNPLQHFSELETYFQESWVVQTVQDHGERMPSSKLVPLLMDLKAPLGLDAKAECEKAVELWREITTSQTELKIKEDKMKAIFKRDAAKQIMEMDIHTDARGYVYYHQILFHFMKNANFRDINISTKPKGDELVEQEEAQSRKRIKALQTGMVIEERGADNAVNPIVQYLFVSTTFKVWKSYLDQYRRKHQDKESDYFSSSYGSNEDDEDAELVVEGRDEDSNGDSDDEDNHHRTAKKFVAIPNTDIYQTNEYLLESESPALHDPEAPEDVMEDYTNQFRQYLVEKTPTLAHHRTGSITDRSSSRPQQQQIIISRAPNTSRIPDDNEKQPPSFDHSPKSAKQVNYLIQNQVFIQNRFNLNGQHIQEEGTDMQVHTNIMPPSPSQGSRTRIKVTTVTEQTFHIYKPENE